MGLPPDRAHVPHSLDAGLDAFWGVEWVHELHTLIANFILAMATVHVFAAITESVLHTWKNLILAMSTGRKRPVSGTDIDHADSARGG